MAKEGLFCLVLGPQKWHWNQGEEWIPEPWIVHWLILEEKVVPRHSVLQLLPLSPSLQPALAGAHLSSLFWRQALFWHHSMGMLHVLTFQQTIIEFTLWKGETINTTHVMPTNMEEMVTFPTAGLWAEEDKERRNSKVRDPLVRISAEIKSTFKNKSNS